jgi:hypothetical protein
MTVTISTLATKMTDIQRAFKNVLGGSNYRVIQLEHPWLEVFVQNVNSAATLLFRELIPDGLQIEDGRGYRVAIDRQGSHPTLSLTSANEGANQVFLRMVEHILEATKGAASKGQAISLIAESVSEFRNFSSKRRDRLTMEEMRGLYAELEVLNFIASSSQFGEHALESWKGPFAEEGIGLHDFVFPGGKAIEVKSSQHPSVTIRVASPDQLRPTSSELRLVVVPLETVRASSPAGRTIGQQVNLCTELLSKSGAEVRTQFMDAIEHLSTEILDSYYDQWKFIASDWKCYEVVEGFPVLPANGIPAGIESIKYSLRLDAIDPFALQTDKLLDWR